jgi:hypothetical protein
MRKMEDMGGNGAMREKAHPCDALMRWNGSFYHFVESKLPSRIVESVRRAAGLLLSE